MAGVEATSKTQIEKFLLAKLQAGIDRKVPHSNKFKSLKESLETRLSSATTDNERGKIREKLYLLNDLMSESNSKLDLLSWSLYSSLKQIKKDLNPPLTNTTVGGQPTPAVAEERSTGTTAPNEEALGLEADQLAVKNLLLYQIGRRQDDFNVVGIVGAEGVGKTTLARSVFARDEEVAERFRPRIWISLAAVADLEKKDEGELQITIASRILLALGIGDETIGKIRQSAGNRSSLAALIHGIRMELMGKRYLIVLDDASRMENWYKDLSLEVELRPKRLEERLGFAFPKGSGGTVLVIGWPEKVVEYMVGKDESGAIHKLLPLEDPKLCWKICEEEAKEDGDGDRMEISEEKNRMADEVVKRANGLPVAARLMGKIRREKKIQQAASNQAAITN